MRGALDFDDLELRAAALLVEREHVRRAWSERFELLMVDEFQDTNPRQLQILSALDRGSLFTVGDEFQSIYGFRHADVRLFRERRDALAASGASLALTRNFRSRAPLLDVVNHLFGERFPGYAPLCAGLEPPVGDGSAEVELLLTDQAGWDVSGGAAAGGQPWRRAEATALAGRICEMIADGLARPGEIVVLLRATGDLDVFEGALAARGLRTLAVVGAFWNQQQVVDLVSYLRALANPLDDLALLSALASPLAGCSLDGLALLARAAHERSASVWEALVPQDGEPLAAADAGAAARLRDLLERERAGAHARSVSQLIERVISACAYDEHVRGLDRAERRLADVHKLLRLARRFEASEGRGLRGFLDHVEHLQRAGASEPDAPVEGVEPDAVRLMTTHAAKGLEFPVVCVADLGRQPNNQPPTMLLDGERIGLRLVALDGTSEPALDYEQLASSRALEEAQEEDRILYVAMTRARRRLLLSGAADFGRWPGPERSPIAWLAPALVADLPDLLQMGGRGASVAVGEAEVALDCRFQRPRDAAEPAAEADPPPQAPPPAPMPPPRSEPREEREGLGVGALSYSSLSELQRCGYRFYLERVLGLPENREAARGGQGGVDARSRGTLVHALMEAVDLAEPRPPDAAAVAQAAARLGVAIAASEREGIAELLARSLGSVAAAGFSRAREVGREHPFTFSLGAEGALVTGVIDLLAVAADGSSLVLDYKSDRLEADADLSALVEREYGIQRTIYALAVLRTGAPAVDVVHWFLERPEEPVSARYDAADAPELEASLALLAGRLRERAFAVSEVPHRALCQTCPGRGGLCSWEEGMTMRERPGESGRDAAEGPLTLF